MTQRAASRHGRGRARDRAARRTAAALAFTGTAVFVLPHAAATPSQAAQSFVASADSLAFQFTETLPGFVGGETPFNGGGPTGSARLDSLGNSTGFAAFPDPGQIFLGGPGLVYGLLKSGAAGLPPVEPPGEPPKYPLYVTSDQDTPASVVDAGFFALRANSADSSSTGSARAGALTPGASRSGAVFADSVVSKAADGSVIATATTTAQSLILGDVTIGQLLTTATMTLSADGKLTRSSDIRMSGVTAAGQAIELSGGGENATQSQQLNHQLAGLLKGSGYAVKVTDPQNLPDAIVAPGVEITGPASVPTVTSGDGSFTLRLGTATASVIRTGSDPAGIAPSGLAPGGVPGSPAATIDSAGLPSTGGVVPSAAAPGIPTANLTTSGGAAAAATVSLLTTGDISSFYAMLAVIAAAFIAASVISRRAGFARGRP